MSNRAQKAKIAELSQVVGELSDVQLTVLLRVIMGSPIAALFMAMVTL